MERNGNICVKELDRHGRRACKSRRKERECGTDKKKQTGRLTEADLPAINAIIAKGDRAEVGPGPNGTVKISHVKRVIVKSGR